MHHYNFISNSSKFNGVSYFEFISKTRLKSMFLIFTHVSHYKPQFIDRIGFLLFRIFNFIWMVNPKIIILKKACGTYFLWIISRIKFIQTFLIQSHCIKVIKVFWYNIFFVSFQNNYNKNLLILFSHRNIISVRFIIS